MPPCPKLATLDSRSLIGLVQQNGSSRTSDWRSSSRSPEAGHGIIEAMLYFQVESVDENMPTLAARGMSFIHPPRVSARGSTSVDTRRAIDGNTAATTDNVTLRPLGYTPATSVTRGNGTELSRRRLGACDIRPGPSLLWAFPEWLVKVARYPRPGFEPPAGADAMVAYGDRLQARHLAWPDPGRVGR